MPRRPDPERLSLWREFLRAHATITRTLEVELQTQKDLPLSWYEVLVHLQDAGGRLRMQELADAVLVAKSSLTRLIDRMEGAGLVERKPVDEDGRGFWATLTAQGKAALRQASPVYQAGIQRQFAQHLTETDVSALARVLAKLNEQSSNRRSGEVA